MPYADSVWWVILTLATALIAIGLLGLISWLISVFRIRQHRLVLNDFYLTTLTQYQAFDSKADQILHEVANEVVTSQRVRYVQAINEKIFLCDEHLKMAKESLDVLNNSYPEDFRMHVATVEEQLVYATAAVEEIGLSIKEYRQLFPNNPKLN